MANLRFEAVAEAFKKRPINVEIPTERPSEYFAKYVFNRQKMYQYLPADSHQDHSQCSPSLPLSFFLPQGTCCATVAFANAKNLLFVWSALETWCWSSCRNLDMPSRWEQRSATQALAKSQWRQKERFKPYRSIWCGLLLRLHGCKQNRSGKPQSR